MSNMGKEVQNNSSSNINKYLESTLRRNIAGNGELKIHSVPLHILTWIIVIGIGIITQIVFPSIISVCGSIIAVSSMAVGVYSIRKSDYRWFLYYGCNTLGIVVCIESFCLCSSLEWGFKYEASLLFVFFLSATLSGIITHVTLKNRIARGYKDRDEGETETGTSIVAVGLCAGGIGTFLASFISGKIIVMSFSFIIGAFVGSVCIISGSIFFYGKKYDPKCEMMKSIQNQMES